MILHVLPSAFPQTCVKKDYENVFKIYKYIAMSKL